MQKLQVGLGIAILLLASRSSALNLKRATPNWAAFNASIGGRLLTGIPWSNPCYSILNGKPENPDPIHCSYVQGNYSDHLNRSDAFGAYQATQWESCMSSSADNTGQCLLDWTDPTNKAAFSPPRQCQNGSIANYYYSVANASDIILAYKFVSQTGIPLVIKNTGHDFKGRSSGPGSLALWMHQLKYISYNNTFVPDGCPPTAATSALTFGAGEQFQDIYTFAAKNGLEFVGGTDPSVGAAGGWGQGGGHSSLTPTLGLGADRALQYKVVTPDGLLRTANACQNTDLFWALRGGGGGTFGVVLEASGMASPSRTYRVANINWEPTYPNLQKVLQVFVDNATTFAEQGWGGYVTFIKGNMIFLTPKLNLTEATISMQALLNITSGMGGISNITEIQSYDDWFKNFVQTNAEDFMGLPIAMTSRLVPQSLHVNSTGRAQILDALLSAYNSTFFGQIFLTTPYGYNITPVSDTSVNPIWRQSLYHVLLVNTWLYNATLSDRKAAYAKSTEAVTKLRNITPLWGAYVNEADIHEPDWQDSFWGTANYGKLEAIKQNYDPSHILDCWQCVGWKGAADPRYSCYI